MATEITKNLPKLKIWDGSKTIEVEANQALEIINKNPEAGLLPNQTFSFVGQDGSVFDADAQQTLSNLQKGLLPVSAKQADFAQEKKEASTTLTGQAKSFAAGAARGISLGLTDLAAKGIDAATGSDITGSLKVLKEANPGLSTAGEVAGNVGGLFIGGPVSTVAKLGAGVTERVGAALLPKAGNVVTQALAKAAAVGAGSAVEGAIYGGGQTLTEASLGNPTNLGENVLIGAGVGGLLGGGLNLVGQVAQPTVGLLGKGFVKSASTVGALDKEVAEDLAKGFTLSKEGELVRDALNNPKKFRQAVEGDLKTIYQKSLSGRSKQFNALEDLSLVIEPQTNAEAVKQSLIGQIDNAISEAERNPFGYKGLQRELEKLKTSIDNIPEGGLFNELRDLRRRVGEFAEFGVPQGPNEQIAKDVYRSIYSSINDELGAKNFGKAGELFRDVDTALAYRYRALDDLSPIFKVEKSGAVSINDNAAKRFLSTPENSDKIRELYLANKQVNAAYQSLIDNFDTAFFGYQPQQIAQNLNKAKEEFSRLSTAGQVQDNIRNLFQGESFTGKSLSQGFLGYAIGGPVGALLGYVVDNPGWVTAKLAKAYGVAGKVPGLLDNKLVEAGQNVIVQQIVTQQSEQRRQLEAFRAIEKQNQVVNKTLNDFIQTKPSATQPAKTSQKALTLPEFKQLRQNLLNQSDDEIVNQLYSQLRGAPETAAAAGQTALRAKNLLVQKLPVVPKDSLGIEKQPSPQQLARFNASLSAISSPLSVVKDLGQGRVSPEALEAVKTVYPALWTSLQEKVRENLKEPEKLSPVRRKVLAAVLDGSPVNQSVGVQSQQIFASALAAQNQSNGLQLPNVSAQPSKRGSLIG